MPADEQGHEMPDVMDTTGRAASSPRDSGVDSNHGDLVHLIDTVRELVRIMRDGGIERLSVSRGDLRIQLSARPDGSSPAATPRSAPAPVVDGPSEPAATSSDSFLITAPMVGTFYQAASPEERPFVSVGDEVAAGQTVAIIEAMKIMNEIVADRPGIVEEILVRNAETVEYGHPLFRLRSH
jgi:acetyl-CoA carboxylase biotin carboxyl carrier protein